MKEIAIGIIASMFFAVTFILNRSMDLSGGSWLWSSSLRFFFMLPMLFLIVILKNNFKQVIHEIKSNPIQWILWSTVGFGLFYAPLTYAASYGPGWLIAGTWQLTIVAGVLLSPLFFQTSPSDIGSIKIRQKIPLKALFISLLILTGAIIIQWQHADGFTLNMLLVGVLPVVIAAFAYPLGNRKMMEVSGGRLDTFQRVFGMTLVSIPFWFVISVYGFLSVGPPSSDQLLQTLIVAISSGVIATTLFFIATDRARKDQGKLAAVEATQSTAILFVIIGEVWLLSSPFPSGYALLGIFIIIFGMLTHSYFSKHGNQKSFSKKEAS
ncbi:multidrug resistance efflux transporter family protein [Evansella tamaricis]|uniref:Multidrug resistance efflux transporter family protein n=1 Tax=Evansella tamaricis TaxID=2069301 RepID=A0ABS6JNJ9_9BACI|nr:multidrug resistance efflux transporter family protein [Evansella tamaricis]MBU9713888.1 multidrug resistance efflux transporter family protein [Evansella tamaricis]